MPPTLWYTALRLENAMTKVLSVNFKNPESERIAEAAAVILRGDLVAFPTETVYGLGAHALDAAAVARIFDAKGRPPEDPLIVHLASVKTLDQVARDIPRIAYKLAETFWPGPLTLILPKQPAVPANVTAGLDTVAVRVPAHPVAMALLRACRVPVAAPSANRFGRTSPTNADHVQNDLSGRIELILDGGSTTIGVESTVLDVTVSPPVILRPGGASRELLEALIGPVEVIHSRIPTEAIVPQISPGLLGKHYAPQAELVLFIGDQALENILKAAKTYLSEGLRVGLLIVEEDRHLFVDLPVTSFNLGPAEDIKKIARNLFAGLRQLDAAGSEVILVRDFGERGLGLAVRDRLRRAASRIVDS